MGDEGMNDPYPQIAFEDIPRTIMYEFQPKFQDLWTSVPADKGAMSKNKTKNPRNELVPDKLHSFPFEFVALESCPPSFEGFFLVKTN